MTRTVLEYWTMLGVGWCIGFALVALAYTSIHNAVSVSRMVRLEEDKFAAGLE